MFTALVLSAAMLGAPIPKATAPAGQAPRVLDLKPEADGKIRLTVVRTTTQKMTSIAVNNGQQQRVEREVKVPRAMQVELSEIKDLAVYTANGKEVNIKDALKKLADGGPVVVTADGNKVDPSFLKLFKDDVLVLVSPELAGPTAPRASTGFIGGGIQAVPLPAQIPGGIQIQLDPIILVADPAQEQKAKPAPVQPKK